MFRFGLRLVFGVVGAAVSPWFVLTSDVVTGVPADVMSPDGSRSVLVGSNTIGNVGFWHLWGSVELVAMGLGGDFNPGSIGGGGERLPGIGVMCECVELLVGVCVGHWVAGKGQCLDGW